MHLLSSRSRLEPGNERPNPSLLDFSLFFAATLLACLCARPYAGGYNDGGRLATIEALIDYHTFAIDDSIFVRPLPADGPRTQSPYRLDLHPNLEQGTGDKARIAGHFYSDKPPVPALWMAGVYQLLQWCFGLTARHSPGLLCYLMAVCSSGLAYVVAVVAVWRLASVLHRRATPPGEDGPYQRSLNSAWVTALTASFAFSTTALPYACQVNGHILSLAAACWLIASLAAAPARPGVLWLLGWGSLGGLAYSFEAPSGGLLLIMTAAYCFFRHRQISDLLWLIFGALPWVLLHHSICYAIAGTWHPIGAVPEFFDYPGSEFDRSNLTGFWNHASIIEFLGYSLGLLFSERGFLLSNLPLLMAIPAAIVLLRRRVAEWPLLVACGGWSIATWLVYAALSTNYAGWCCSIRWFEPLLAPGYLVLILAVRRPATLAHPVCLIKPMWIVNVRFDDLVRAVGGGDTVFLGDSAGYAERWTCVRLEASPQPPPTP